MIFLSYLILGAFAGTLAGLFGIGGGLVIVPVLVYSFEIQGLSPEILTHLAVGTSLATIIITSLGTIRAHQAKGAIRWNLFLLLSIGILSGTWLGVFTAVQMTGELLQITIGIFAILIAAKMWFGFKAQKGTRLPARPLIIVAGSFIGWASSIFGIGGGTISVPFLRKCNLKMTESVATSAACGLPIALTGTAANIYMGQGNELLPGLTTGFVYWPAFFGIILTSMPFARLGANLAHHLSSDRLQKLFSAFLFLVGLDFLL